MIVWQLIESDYEGEFTVGTFSTKRKAMEYLAAATVFQASQGYVGPDWTVVDYELDPDPTFVIV